MEDEIETIYWMYIGDRLVFIVGLKAQKIGTLEKHLEHRTERHRLDRKEGNVLSCHLPTPSKDHSTLLAECQISQTTPSQVGCELRLRWAKKTQGLATYGCPPPPA